jgi:hypothetical protein
MTVPPLPRDCASRPLLGKAAGSRPNAGEVKEVKRITTKTMVKICVIVFMLLLIYGERSGVKRAVRRTQNAEHRRKAKKALDS